LYTEREVEALNRGGVQRLHIGNLRVGKHELVAFFTGKGPNERDYKRGATLTFEKGVGAKYLELRISDRVSKQQPEFVVKEWE
ncbi:MAG: AraC family transcriptional regulator, partial [Pseudomonadota bacterium]